MLSQTTTTTTLSISDRAELALIRNDLVKALREVEPDTHALHAVVQRLDKLLAPAKLSAAATPRSENLAHPVARSLFAGW